MRFVAIKSAEQQSVLMLLPRHGQTCQRPTMQAAQGAKGKEFTSLAE